MSEEKGPKTPARERSFHDSCVAAEPEIPKTRMSPPDTTSVAVDEPTRKMLEMGELYAFYKPKKNIAEPVGFEDTQCFFLVLASHGPSTWRLLIVGKKRLPTVSAYGERSRPQWAMVHRVSRGSPEPVASVLREGTGARPCGEGACGIYAHGGHTHFAYVLAVPGKAAECTVQSELGLRQQASFLVSIKNPLRRVSRASTDEFEEGAREKFAGGRAWVALCDPRLLDTEGAELLLIADVRDRATFEGGELEGSADAMCEGGIEGEVSALASLGLDLSKTPLKPLFEGTWA